MSGFSSPDFWLGVLTIAAIYATFTLGVQLNMGFTGITNLGQSGFMAVGAYTMALLVLKAEWPFLLACLAGVVASALFAVLVGLPSLRLPDDYFAIVTLAAASIVVIVVQNLVDITGGNNGLSGFDSSWIELQVKIMEWLEPLGLGNQFALPLTLVAWAAFLVLALALRTLQRTPWGRVLRGIREDEVATEALGKNVLAYKLQSLAISGMCAAVAGVLMALNLSVVYPNSFSLDVMFTATAVLLLCGLGSYLGIAYGAVLMFVVLEGARFADLPLSSDRVAALRMIIVGVVLVVTAMYRPQGLFGNKQEMVLRG
ncbi:branched-chain amino acid ABC transporter permease [Nocardioides sp. LHG3406-4]|uniref:branched-chain amino acid ABC transporter permease n=1 Tax=Nocardioides sp. LHG3406-4 TaxID=2804575 RepID=UPI003CE7826C